jgi:predicted DNA-binding transcriptional regulator YafY
VSGVRRTGRPRERSSRAPRLFALSRYLQARAGRTVAEIVERFAISERTVYRDLNALEESGVPVEHDHGRYRVYEERPPTAILDSSEVALVRIALSNPALADGGLFGGKLKQLVDRLEKMLRGTNGKPIPLAGLDPSGAGAERVMSELERLTREGRPATIRYESLSGGSEAERGVDPYRLFHRAGAWYLIGRCHLHDEPRLFRLDRIHSVRTRRGAFRTPPSFDLEHFLADAWNVYVGPERHDVKLYFAASLAPLIENARHHAGETQRRLDDGTIDYRVTVSRLDEIARWIVGFGKECRVVQPKSLAARVRKLAEGALAAQSRD